MSEQAYPYIHADYMLMGEDRAATLDFEYVSKEYADARPEVEEAGVEVIPDTEGEKYDFIKIGRFVTQKMSYGEIANEADLMQKAIEKQLETLGYGELIARSRAGNGPSGNLPDQE